MTCKDLGKFFLVGTAISLFGVIFFLSSLPSSSWSILQREADAASIGPYRVCFWDKQIQEAASNIHCGSPGYFPSSLVTVHAVVVLAVVSSSLFCVSSVFHCVLMAPKTPCVTWMAGVSAGLSLVAGLCILGVVTLWCVLVHRALDGWHGYYDNTISWPVVLCTAGGGACLVGGAIVMGNAVKRAGQTPSAPPPPPPHPPRHAHPVKSGSA
ncbi:uncharacterized protein LOC106013777, partial [Aplysia californica]|uniref:Uncharacterized protein LOC106013777 n=1 Tax=Aplysia californica TaxID=6500 RepID=A0ABM1ADY4_APLCA